MPNDLRSSRKHPIHSSFSWLPTQPAPPTNSILRTSRTLAVSYPPCAPQIPRTDKKTASLLAKVAPMLSLPVLIIRVVCMYVWSSHIAEYGSTGLGCQSCSRGQLNRENNIPLSPCVPEMSRYNNRKSGRRRDCSFANRCSESGACVGLDAACRSGKRAGST